MAPDYCIGTNQATWTSWTTDTSTADTYTGSDWHVWNNPDNSTTNSITAQQSATWYYWTYSGKTSIDYNADNSWPVWVSLEKTENQLRKERRKNRLERRKERALTSRKERIRQEKLRQQQLKEELKQKQEARRQEKIEKRRQKKAQSKAWELLEDVITPEETKRYKETGRLLVHGQKYDWLIRKPTYEGSKPGVVRAEKGILIDICIHTNNGKDSEIPEADRIVSLALSAKFNEEAFNKECNKWGDVQIPESYFEECGNF